ncbi:hypothetical protein ACIQ7N_21885 [Lysinibacillus sp. NPDC095746]|uniref:hypothetical protein n=1 Tax=Lysinibacillus sp. NPDC095746 TaxID=3364134 RepID=UPI0038210CAF
MYAGTLIPSVDLRFKADFCSHQGAYDELSRVYSASVSAYEWDFIGTPGVYRAKETLEYSAYGGIKAKVRPKEGANQRTDYVYLRVAKDTYRVDSSF